MGQQSTAQVISLCNVGPAIDPDKIANYFSLQSCLWTVGQHYAGKFFVQFWRRHIKTTLYMVILLRKDDYEVAVLR